MKVLFITFFVVIADQVTKILVKGLSIPSLGINIEGMPYQSSKKVIGDFFKFTFIENPGMAFGLQITGKLFLSLFTIAATILLIFFLYKNRNENLTLRLALAFILGGAIGNLIDRVFYGEIYSYAPLFYGRVVDFLHFDFPNFTIFGKTIYSWPIFNIADISVTVGFLLILIGYKKAFPNPEEKDPVIETAGDLEFEHREYFEGESLEISQIESTEFIEGINKKEPAAQNEERIYISADEINSDEIIEIELNSDRPEIISDNKKEKRIITESNDPPFSDADIKDIDTDSDSGNKKTD